MIKVYNRQTRQIEEVKHFGKVGLSIIYKSKFLTNVMTSKPISKIYGFYNKLGISKFKIKKFIKDNNIDISLFEEKKYRNYNEFFTRKYKKLTFDKTGFVSPCDAKLLVYKIDSDLKVKVKNITYSIQELINNQFEEYKNGYMFIYRLSVDDCHRYYHIDDGKLIQKARISGRLHTVSSSSDNYKIYKVNEREYSILDTKHYGRIIYMEVGAMLIGKIVNNSNTIFKRGDEKGYFLPGGSTIILIANNIKVDEDILKYSSQNIETLVKIGEKVGIYEKNN